MDTRSTRMGHVASLATPSISSLASILLGELADRLAQNYSAPEAILIVASVIPTLATITVIAYYKRPIAAAAGMALASFAWYYLSYQFGADTLNYMDIPGSLAFLVVDELAGGVVGLGLPIIASIASFLAWLVVGKLIVVAVLRLEGP